MKTFYFLLGILVLLSCTPEDCKSKEETEKAEEEQTVVECADSGDVFLDVLASVNINCFDNIFNSPRQGQIFSILEIKQNRFRSCLNGKYNYRFENIVTFKNVTDYTITFDYKITQNLNGSYREYQGFVSNLSPNQVDVKNTGNSTFYNVKNSEITVQVTNITYN